MPELFGLFGTGAQAPSSKPRNVRWTDTGADPEPVVSREIAAGTGKTVVYLSACNALADTMRGLGLYRTLLVTASSTGEDDKRCRANLDLFSSIFKPCGVTVMTVSAPLTAAPSGAMLVRSRTVDPTIPSPRRVEPDWIDAVNEVIDDLSKLKEDWDSYRARPIQASAVQAAKRLLADSASLNTPRPKVGPTCLGGVQIEWHRKGYDVEIDVGPEGAVSAFIQHVPSDQVLWDGRVDDLRKLPDWIKLVET